MIILKRKNGNKSRLLFTATDSLMHEIKSEDFYEDFSKDNNIFDFSNYSTKSKLYDDSNKLFVRKVKGETDGVPTKECVGLKPKIYSFLVDDSRKHKKAKGVNKNLVATISHNKYKDVLLNNKCLRQLMNRIQSKNHRVGPWNKWISS